MAMSSKKRTLVVADKAADSPALVATLKQRDEYFPSTFTLLVPAVPHGFAWVADMKAGWTEAILHAERAVARIGEEGLDLVETIIGDPDPLAAAGDALHSREFDEVLVVCSSRRIPRWSARRLGGYLRRTLDLPVSEVIVDSSAHEVSPRSREVAAA